MSEQLQKFYLNPFAPFQAFDQYQHHSAELPVGFLPGFSPCRYINT